MSIDYQRRAFLPEGNRIEKFKPLIAKYARKFHQRAVGLNMGWEQEDVEQELSLIFYKCQGSYDPEKGGSFMNFVITAFFNEMNAKMRKAQKQMDRGVAFVSNMQGGEEGESLNLFDTIDSGHATPEQNVEALQCIEHALRGMSEPASSLVKMLMDPPDPICIQFELLSKGTLARREALKDGRRSPQQLSLSFLFDLFKVPKADARRIQMEIEKKVGNAFLLAR